MSYSRYSHEIDWMDYYWQMVLGGTHKLILGLHLEGNYDRVQQLPIKEVTTVTSCGACMGGMLISCIDATVYPQTLASLPPC